MLPPFLSLSLSLSLSLCMYLMIECLGKTQWKKDELRVGKEREENLVAPCHSIIGCFLSIFSSHKVTQQVKATLQGIEGTF